MERLTKVLRAWEGMRTSDLLRLLQDIAGEDAERRGAGRPALVERGCVWVLVRNRLDIRRFPVPGESFRVTTWPMKGRLGLYPRLFELSAADQKQDDKQYRTEQDDEAVLLTKHKEKVLRRKCRRNFGQRCGRDQRHCGNPG